MFSDGSDAHIIGRNIGRSDLRALVDVRMEPLVTKLFAHIFIVYCRIAVKIISFNDRCLNRFPCNEAAAIPRY